MNKLDRFESNVTKDVFNIKHDPARLKVARQKEKPFMWSQYAYMA